MKWRKPNVDSQSRQESREVGGHQSGWFVHTMHLAPIDWACAAAASLRIQFIQHGEKESENASAMVKRQRNESINPTTSRGGNDPNHECGRRRIDRRRRTIELRADVSSANNMDATTPAIRELARRLIALEPRRDALSEAGEREGARACETFRKSLTKLVGIAGYRSLISRAMAKAKAEVPALNSVRVGLDGSLEGFDGIERDQDAEAQIVVLVHLLSLLVTFIGERLTLSLVRDAWPEAPLNETGPRAERQS